MTLYHYCSNDTFLKIIENSELWLSELTLSNDSMEGTWARKVLLEVCRTQNWQPRIMDEAEEKISFLLDAFSAAGFCLSVNGDQLSQWRGYADNGAGVAIAFDRKTIEELCKNTPEKMMGPFLGQVVYDSSEQEKAIEKNINKLLCYIDIDAPPEQSKILRLIKTMCLAPKNEYIHLHNDAFTMLEIIKLSFLLKNSSFWEEEEWRIFSITSKVAYDDDSLSIKTYNDPKIMDFRARGDHIVPYLRLSIPKCIKRIILGPRNRTPEPVIRAALEKYGFHNVEIEPSKATYR